MTINYLKQFEPGEPIDIEVLNKVIQNVNFLASQIAQIYKLPAPQAPVVTNAGATGGTSGSTTTPTNPADAYAPITDLSINLSYIARFNQQTLTKKNITVEMVQSALGGKTIKSFQCVGVNVKSLMFIPAGAQEGTLRAATGAQLSGLQVSNNQLSYTPKPVTGKYTSGSTGPSSTSTGMYGRLYVNLGLDIKVTY